MKTNTTSDTGVSPVVGTILMVSITVLFVTLASGVILSRYDEPRNPPSADVIFDQNNHSNLNQTSNLRITIAHNLSAEQINITPQDSSINLYSKSDGTPYLAYKTDNSTACSAAGKSLTATKQYCILNPTDSSYNPKLAQGQTIGEELYICHIPEGTVFQTLAKNQRGTRTIGKYKTIYKENVSQFTIKDIYDHPCNSN